MAETKVIMPQMGESIFEGTVTKWLKKVGDTVQRDEPLFEISTDKVDSEIPSPAAGTLRQILVPEGQTVQINTVVAVIGDGSGQPVEAPPPKEAAKPPAEQKPVQEIKKGPAPIAGPAEPEEEEESEHLRSSPLVRRIAKEHGVDLSALSGKGTGIDGRITKADILSFIEQRGSRPGPTAPPPSQAPRPAERPSGPPPIEFKGE